MLTTSSALPIPTLLTCDPRHHDHIIPARRGQLHGWRLHSTPLQVEGVTLQTHLQGALPLLHSLHRPVVHLQEPTDRVSKRVSTSILAEKSFTTIITSLQRVRARGHVLRRIPKPHPSVVRPGFLRVVRRQQVVATVPGHSLARQVRGCH